MSRVFRNSRLNCIVATLLGIASSEYARCDETMTSGSAGRLGGSVTLASDYVFRGTSQTMGRPSLQLEADADLGHGFYAYVWGTNVDFHPDSEADDGARMEIDLAVGYWAAIGELWSVDLVMVRYLFPGTSYGISYDYNELITTWRYKDRVGARIGFAKNVDGTDANSWFYELDTSFELPRDVTIEFGVGYYDLQAAFGEGYSYAKAALSRNFDDNALRLSFDTTFGDADELFYSQATGPRLVFSLEIPF